MSVSSEDFNVEVGLSTLPIHCCYDCMVTERLEVLSFCFWKLDADKELYIWRGSLIVNGLILINSKLRYIENPTLEEANPLNNFAFILFADYLPSMRIILSLLSSYYCGSQINLISSLFNQL
jgi:hypothetical protein